MIWLAASVVFNLYSVSEQTNFTKRLVLLVFLTRSHAVGLDTLDISREKIIMTSQEV